MHNKIIIESNKKREKKDIAPISYNTDTVQIPASGNEHQEINIPVDENVWGNDHMIINKLDEKQLADRRLFARVRYIQRVECTKVYTDSMTEPVILTRPFVFTISDLSMGGIGMICDQAIRVGEVLAFKMSLDNILYEIKCEVVYCIRNSDKFRAGLKIVKRDRQFIRHLKIYVARISLNNYFGNKS